MQGGAANVREPSKSEHHGLVFFFLTKVPLHHNIEVQWRWDMLNTMFKYHDVLQNSLAYHIKVLWHHKIVTEVLDITNLLESSLYILHASSTFYDEVRLYNAIQCQIKVTRQIFTGVLTILSYSHWNNELHCNSRPRCNITKVETMTSNPSSKP